MRIVLRDTEWAPRAKYWNNVLYCPDSRAFFSP